VVRILSPLLHYSSRLMQKYVNCFITTKISYFYPVLHAKKIFCISMVMYLLALIMLPCNDACEGQHHQAPLVFNQAQDHHQEDQDICSPLCGCSCCSAQIIVQSNFFIQNTDPVRQEKFVAHLPLSVSELHYSIWQPPKFV